MAWIDKGLEYFLHGEFPCRTIKGYYEYFQENVELHLEGKFQSEDYRDFAKELRVKTANDKRLSWLSWQGHSQCRCRINGATDSPEDLLRSWWNQWKNLKESSKRTLPPRAAY